jgi:tetratricopeptide (TPR) repeat protein
MWKWNAAAFTLTLLLMLQGFSLRTRLNRPAHVRVLGTLNLCAAVLWLLTWMMLASGIMVIGPELARLMVRGINGRAGMTALLTGIGIFGAMAWHAARTRLEKPNRIFWLIVAAVAIGGLSAARLVLLNPDDSAASSIYRYDLWWPPMLMWMCVCLSGAVCGLAGWRSNSVQPWLAALMAAGLGLVATSRMVLADLSSQILWIGYLLTILPVTMAAAPIHTLVLLNPDGVRRKLIAVNLAMPLLLLGGLIGLLIRQLHIHGNLTPIELWQKLPLITVLLIWLGWLGLVFSVILGPRLYRTWRSGAYSISALSRHIVRKGLLIAASAVLFISLVDLFYLMRFDPGADLMWFILSWLLAIELTVGRFAPVLLHKVDRKDLAGTALVLKYRIKGWLAGLDRAMTRTKEMVKEFISVTSLANALFKTLLAIVLLIALCDLPNAGKTIVQPFRVDAVESSGTQSGSAAESLGKSLADRVVHKLAALRQELRPDVVRVLAPTKRDEATFRPIAAGESGSGIDAALAKSGDLELGNVKIPLSLLAAPVHIPLRRVLNVRVISGSLQADKDGYLLIASSTNGETWTARVAYKDVQTAPTAPPKINDALDALAEQLAFEILSTDQVLINGGLTHSWEVFKTFRLGLTAWSEFERNQDYDALTRAVWLFKEAAMRDPKFALAHYRLGFALQRDGQPAAATSAFRDAVKANPGLTASLVALASSLYDFDSYYYPRPMALKERPAAELEARTSRCNEARELWRQVIEHPARAGARSDMAAAFYGLCREAHGKLLNPREARQAEDRQHQFDLAYFYCRRSGALYTQLAAERGGDASLLGSEAAVLNEMGVMLEEEQSATGKRISTQLPDIGWICRSGKIDMMAREGLVQGPLSYAAKRYYERASSLAPYNPAIRCNAASCAYLLGDPEPMKALAAGSEAHISLARSLADSARNDPSLYGQAIAEYDLALACDPSSMDALTGYGYTFWEWQYRCGGGANCRRPDSEVAHRAERYAHRAITMHFDHAASSNQAILLSTLGEVLLGQARPHEAYEHLEKAVACAPEHALYNEVRWDLAQAYLCAGNNDSESWSKDKDAQARAQTLKGKAIPLFKFIQDKEQYREEQPFLRNPDCLDPSRSQSACRRHQGLPELQLEKRPDPDGPYFELREGKPRYSGYAICNWMGVTADAFDMEGRPSSDLQLHLWGGGIERRITVGAPRANIVLGTEPRTTHDYYFAQLEDSKRKALSKVYSIPTFANEKNGGCPNNLIQLNFEQKR